FLGIINGICSPGQMENDSLQSSMLELNNRTINIIWAQADFSELYNVLQKVTELKRNSADVVYVHSTNHRIIMTISNLKTTPTLHLNDVDKERVESFVAPEKYPYSNEMKPKLHNSPTETCLSIRFGETYFDEETLSVMVARILTHLNWKSTITFFENATEHNVGKILDRVSEIGVNHRTYNFDSLKDAKEIRGVLDLIHSEFIEGMANITLICQLNCTRRVLNEANNYDILPLNYRRTALRDHTFWFVITELPNDLTDLINASSVLDNVCVLNLNVTSAETVMDSSGLIDKQQMFHRLENMTELVKTTGSSDAILALKNYSQSIFSSKSCRTYPVYTLMWKEDSYNGTSLLVRQLENVGEVGIDGKFNFHSKIFPNIDFGFNMRNLLVTTAWWPPFTERIQKDGKTVDYFGLCADLLDELANELNFTYTYTEPPDNEFGRIFPNRSWSGMIGQLERREVDLMVAAASIQGSRENVMDFTQPFYYDTTTILIKRPDPDENKMFTLAKPFKIEVIICIFFVLPVSAFLLFIIETLSPYYKIHGPEGRQNYQKSFWYMFGALLTQGGESLPNSQSGRTMITFFWLFSIIMVATYSGNLIAFLTVTIDKPPFNSLEEMVEQDEYKWGILAGTYFVTWFQESPFEILQKVWTGIKTFNETDPDVLNSDPNVHISKMYKEKYVYIGDKSFMEIRKTNRCELVTATEEIPNMSYAVGLPNNSLYTKLFSDKILSLQEGGILQTFKRKHWPREEFCHGSLTAKAKEVQLIDVQAAFIVVGAGLVLGTIVLFLEKIVKHLSTKICMKKEHNPCKHIRTVPTMESELDRPDLNGISSGVFTIDEGDINVHMKNRVHQTHSSDGYG
ncbi:glutamate receptor ionotropic, delta-2-like, partial [Saccostrea cucullata]|uniref:glutamate receptor ionotropic, delta-2-like n=1 Tax=Saccostrea cuccullata TaxID=36930 RepID=UPI002ED35C9C